MERFMKARQILNIVLAALILLLALLGYGGAGHPLVLIMLLFKGIEGVRIYKRSEEAERSAGKMLASIGGICISSWGILSIFLVFLFIDNEFLFNDFLFDFYSFEPTVSIFRVLLIYGIFGVFTYRNGKQSITENGKVLRFCFLRQVANLVLGAYGVFAYRLFLLWNSMIGLFRWADQIDGMLLMGIGSFFADSAMYVFFTVLILKAIEDLLLGMYATGKTPAFNARSVLQIIRLVSVAIATLLYSFGFLTFAMYLFGYMGDYFNNQLNTVMCLLAISLILKAVEMLLPNKKKSPAVVSEGVEEAKDA